MICAISKESEIWESTSEYFCVVDRISCTYFLAVVGRADFDLAVFGLVRLPEESCEVDPVDP